ncbi:hypothetical protein PR202_ga10120 [Eleusine coracana subsp. coracana]|uniref:Uncharacterized protein n=1 Tax=Eleusine coracana subsp. coracana TaxID=191504 RepID=A0AAV5C5W3_ELECO|nr:hypothetical protein PR202_ga10120 [Eleusine coracana subsp. coracana]
MVRAEMKPPTDSGKGGVADPSVPRFKCQECRRTLVVDGVESFVDRLPTHATSGNLTLPLHAFGVTNP